ncbi:MAG: DUF4058 family protein [Spirulinaceae cyanobacterium]
MPSPFPGMNPYIEHPGTWPNVHHLLLEIRDIAKNEVVTVIEVLSPVNKRPGKGRRKYQLKRQRILETDTNLVEIDLLRKWPKMLTRGKVVEANDRILVSRSCERPQADLYAFNLSEAIPAFPLPLRSEDEEPIVDVQGLLDNIYDQSGYDLVINYTKEPMPALQKKDAVWVDEFLQEKGFR